MPDITMCQNKKCPSNTECYRFTATPNPYRQSYANYTLDEGDDRCNWFTPNEHAAPEYKGDE